MSIQLIENLRIHDNQPTKTGVVNLKNVTSVENWPELKPPQKSSIGMHKASVSLKIASLKERAERDGTFIRLGNVDTPLRSGYRKMSESFTEDFSAPAKEAKERKE